MDINLDSIIQLTFDLINEFIKLTELYFEKKSELQYDPCFLLVFWKKWSI
jgi:hypothetical protein